MPRNLDRRVEAVAPVQDPELREQLMQLMELYLQDSEAWHMQSDGSFVQLQPENEGQVTQALLMKQWRRVLKR
jgi:polyphosphate kinase